MAKMTAAAVPHCRFQRKGVANKTRSVGVDRLGFTESVRLLLPMSLDIGAIYKKIDKLCFFRCCYGKSKYHMVYWDALAMVVPYQYGNMVM